MIDQPYTADLLAPSRVPDAEARNAPLLGPRTLGIEVTERGLADRCGLGNIDPQHGFGAGEGRSAIEAAISWTRPPPGTRLVTIRPDADAFGAMAVLSLRARGVALGAAARGRIALVARCDAFERGEWGIWRAEQGPLPRPALARDMAPAPPDYAAMAALAADRARTPDERLAAFEAWLLTGDIPAGARAASAGFTETLARAWNDGAITIDFASPGLARIEGATPGALMLGYRFAPLVVAFAGRDIPRQVTIAQFSAGYVDLAAVASDLNAEEPGWGGSATIVGSPQGVGSRLSEARILMAVESYRAATPLPGAAGGG